MLSAAGFTQMQVVAIRVTAAAIALTLYILVKDRSLLRVKLRDCWCFVGTGIISLVFFNWCYFTAIELTSLAVAAVLMYTSPIFVMLFSALLFHERITGKKVVALLMTFLGCLFVAGVFGSSDYAFSLSGILIGIGAGVGYALYGESLLGFKGVGILLIFGSVVLLNHTPKSAAVPSAPCKQP